MSTSIDWIAVFVVMLLAPAGADAQDVAAQIREHAGDHRLVVLGEQHGTNETPRLVQALIESYVAEKTPLHLALELPTTASPALAAYMASDGGVLARKALRATAYWSVATQLHDGRRSEEILELIEAMRRLRQQGRDVQLSAFDRLLPSTTAGAGAGARDAGMAAELRARFSALPVGGRMVVLTGNVHGTRKQPRYLAYPTMMMLVQDLDVYNVRIGAREGEVWGCRSERECGRIPLKIYEGPSPVAGNGGDRSYDLQVWLPRFTVARVLGAVDDLP